MNALITGFTGFVGSHLADYLLWRTDWKIFGLCRWRSPLDNVAHLVGNERVKFLYGNLLDPGSLDKAVKESKPDYVFHLAAQTFPLASFNEPALTLETNVTGTLNLLEAVRNHADNPPTHVCSSSEVFGRVPKEKLPINEECSFHPASSYAISKVGTDLLGRFYGEAYRMRTVTTRMFTHTGPRRGDYFCESSFAKQIAMIEAGLIPPVIKVGNLDSLRTWADVRDAVRAYHLLVTVNPIAGEYYNIGGSYSCTVGAMLDFLLSLSTARNIKIEQDPERMRPLDADLQVPDCSKFKQHTGWEPEIPFEKTMADLLNYWRNKVKKEGRFLTR